MGYKMKSFGKWFAEQKPAVPAVKIGDEESATCNRDGCQGVMQYVRQGPCYCHNSPPCHYCVDAPLICNACDADPEDEAAGK